MRQSKSQVGMSLVWILVVSGSLSLSLIHFSYENKISSDRRAFQFSISQIHSVLNLATAYRLESNVGEWPLTNSGDCMMPDEYINNFGALHNGWGFEIEGVSDCADLGDRYAIEQIVPEVMFPIFEEALNENVSESFGNVPNGMVRLIIEIDLALIDDKKIHVGKLTNYSAFPLEFDSLQCGELERENYIASLDSFCGQAPDRIFDTTFNPPEAIMGGVEVFIDDSYNSQQITYRTYVSNEDWYRGNDEWPSDDGHRFADEDCPSDRNQPRYQIDSVMLAWCE